MKDNRLLFDSVNTPFTRLLLDSNFVSITDMADSEGGGGCKSRRASDVIICSEAKEPIIKKIRIRLYANCLALGGFYGSGFVVCCKD
jgi:hypothetical protein